MASAYVSNGSGRATRCVVCDAAEPDSGKLLHCLHVVCAPCLQECVSGEGGHVQCALCSAKTTAQWRGADLSKQLVDCPTLLYDRRSYTAGLGTRVRDTAMAMAVGSEGSDGAEIVGVCEVCEGDVEEGLLEIARKASAQCESCDGILLCSIHAGKHTKVRRYRDHSVVELSMGHPAEGGRWRCPLHPKHDVSEFCGSCEHGVCERCRAVGHNGHAVESIASVAVKYRAMLKETLQKCNTMTTTTTANTNHDVNTSDAEKLSAVAALQDEVTQVKGAVEEQAKAASRRITKAFNDAQKMLEKQKEEVLRKVDTLLWQSTQPLLEKGQRLSRLEDEYSNVITLAQRIAGGESKEQHVVQIATAVQRNVEKMLTQLEAEKTPVVCAAIIATEQPLSELEACLGSLVLVRESCVDVEKTKVEIADDISVDDEAEATARLYDSSNRAIAADQPTPNVKAEIVSASGRRQPAMVSKKAAVHGSAQSQLTLSIGWKVFEVGQHTLELSMAGRKKAVRFHAQVEVLKFDPAKCSARLAQSNNDHTATCREGSGGNASGAAMEGYVTGRHMWSVRVCNGADSSRSIAFGVTVLPRNGDYSGRSRHFFDLRRAYLWWCNGVFRQHSSPQATAAANSARWQDGDVVTFTLDCEGKSLELYLHRTGERCVTTGIQCHEPLYPAVNLRGTGQTVEFCPVPE